MTNTMRDRFEEWFDPCNIGVIGATDAQMKKLAWSAYQAAHADMLPVLERVRDALRWYANEEFQSDVIDVGSCGVASVYDSDTACLKAQQALTELEAIMKGEKELSKIEVQEPL